jgi:hypothetical protein
MAQCVRHEEGRLAEGGNSDNARRVLTILADLITFRESGQMPATEREEQVGHEDGSEE